MAADDGASAHGERRVGAFWSARASTFDRIYEFATLWDLFIHAPLQIRHDATMDLVRALGSPTVCDVGCGSGRQLVAALRAGAQRAVGIDLSEEMIRLARRRVSASALGPHVSLHLGNALTWQPIERFDLVWALGVFDYEQDPLPLLRKIADLSRGRVLVTFRRVWALRSPFRKVSYALNGRPIYLYTRRGVRQALLRAGMRDLSVKRLTAGLYIAYADAPAAPASR